MSRDELVDGQVPDDGPADERLTDGRLADGRLADGRLPDGWLADGRLAEVVTSIGGRARAVNQDRAARLRDALTELAAGCRAESRRRDAAEIAHQLVGSAGTFGYVEASELAAAVERFLRSEEVGDPARLAVARGQVRRLTQVLAGEPDDRSDYQPEDERDPAS